jgi:hypothetical protein
MLGYLVLIREAWRMAAKIIDSDDFAGYLHCQIYLIEYLHRCLA